MGPHKVLQRGVRRKCIYSCACWLGRAQVRLRERSVCRGYVYGASQLGARCQSNREAPINHRHMHAFWVTNCTFVRAWAVYRVCVWSQCMSRDPVEARLHGRLHVVV